MASWRACRREKTGAAAMSITALVPHSNGIGCQQAKG
jgi:hypothetical protein